MGSNPPDSDAQLTLREREVLALLRLGLTDAEIAKRLGITRPGVSYHVSQIMSKLGVRNRHEAASWPEEPPWWARMVLPEFGLGRRTAALQAQLTSLAGATSVLALVLLTLAAAGLMVFLLARGESGVRPTVQSTAIESPARIVSTTVTQGVSPDANPTTTHEASFVIVPTPLFTSVTTNETPTPVSRGDLRVTPTAHADTMEPSPSPWLNGSAVRVIAGGTSHTCTVTNAGDVTCWGTNGNGQLGSDEADATRVDVTELRGNAVAVSAGDFSTCAITKQHRVVCWGSNIDGQLGRGYLGESDPHPAEVVGLTGATEVTVGAQHACALLDSGKIFCWGWGGWGQVARDVFGFQATPVEVTGLDVLPISVTAGTYGTCALLETRQVQCWGAPVSDVGHSPVTLLNGDGTTLTDVAQVAFGRSICVRTVDGGISCRFGATMLPVLEEGDRPLAGARSIDASDYYSCALTESGLVKCWEINYDDNNIAEDVANVGEGALLITIGTQVCVLLEGGEIQCL